MKKIYNKSKSEIVKKSEVKTLFQGGGSSYPTVVSDNLFHDDFLEIILGIGEGPIEGLVDGEKSFYIDSTPLVSANGQPNFPEYELITTNGDASQDERLYPKLGLESPVEVGSSLGSLVGYDSSDPTDVRDPDDMNNPRARYAEIRNYDDFDYIDIRIQVSQLLYTTADGDQLNGSFSFSVKYQEIGSTSWVSLPVQTISGKTTTGFIKDYRLWLAEFGSQNNLRIRVVSTNDKPGTNGNQFSVSWAGVSVGKANKSYEFKNTACAKLLLRSGDRLSSQPQVHGIYKLLKIKVPTNYDPETHTYEGLWDGLFKVAWTDNPAWVLYDVLTNSRYGMCSFYDFQVNKMDFYDAAQYCDVMVPNGRGGYEPRYTFNGIVDQKKYGRDLCIEIANTFNGVLYEDLTGEARLKVCRDDDPAVHIFTKENVLDGVFNYSFSDPSTWFNAITVTFVNAERDWIQDQKTITDEESIQKYGRNEHSLNLYGCIREQEAMRKAWYSLLSSTTETLSITFSTTRAGLNCSPGDVILVCDPDLNYGLSGRIKSVSEDRLSCALRDPIFIEASIVGGGNEYFADFQVGDEIKSYKLVPNGVGDVRELKFEEELDPLIEKYSLFTIRTSKETLAGNAKPYRILTISESKGNPESISIAAIEINRNKQHDSDYLANTSDGEYSNGFATPEVPHILDLTFDEYFDKKEKCAYLDLNPVLDTRYKYYNGKYKVYWRYLGEGAWNEIDTIFVSTIKSPPSGEIEWVVLPYNSLGYLPDLNTAPIFRYDTYDLATPPDNVTGVEVQSGLTTARITWNVVKDPDIMCYEVREGSDWESGEILTFSTTNPEYTYTFKDLSQHRVMIKAKDIIGTYSEIPAVVYVEAGYPENVKEFYVTPNNDYLRFDWSAIGDANVEYEVRTGNSTWGSGITLFKTKSLNQTVLNPSHDYRGYLIKAVSSLGRYSEKAIFTEYKMELKQDRNVIVTIDNTENVRASGWIEFSKNPEVGEKIRVEDKNYVFGTDVEIGDSLVETLHNIEMTVDPNVFFQSDEMNRITLISNEAGEKGNRIEYSTTCVGASVDSDHLQGGLDKWGGITQGFVVNELQQTLQMDDGEYYAEHFFPVHLASKIRARNWFEVETYKFDSSLVFADLDFPWNSEEAKNTTWLNSSGVAASEGQGIPVISWKEEDRYFQDLGFPLDGQLNDVKNNVEPTSQSQVTYGPNRMSEGLVVNRLVDVRYDLDLPETFTFRFTIKTTFRTINYYEIMRFYGDGIYLDITKEDENIIFRWSDGVVQIVPFKRFTAYDYIFVQLDQNEVARQVKVATEKAGHFEENNVEAPPLGKFTNLIVGSRY